MSSDSKKRKLDVFDFDADGLVHDSETELSDKTIKHNLATSERFIKIRIKKQAIFNPTTTTIPLFDDISDCTPFTEETIDEKTFVPIVDFPDYSINRCGQIRNVRLGHILKGALEAGGYIVVRLYRDGKMKDFKIHHLVASSFIPNPFDLPIVDYIDHDKTNNNWKNLRWVTQTDNAQSRRKTGKPVTSRYKGVAWAARHKKWAAYYTEHS